MHFDRWAPRRAGEVPPQAEPASAAHGDVEPLFATQARSEPVGGHENAGRFAPAIAFERDAALRSAVGRERAPISELHPHLERPLGHRADERRATDGERFAREPAFGARSVRVHVADRSEGLAFGEGNSQSHAELVERGDAGRHNPLAARLVRRRSRPLEHDDGKPAPRRADGDGEPRGTRSDHRDVERLTHRRASESSAGNPETLRRSARRARAPLLECERRARRRCRSRRRRP